MSPSRVIRGDACLAFEKEDRIREATIEEVRRFFQEAPSATGMAWCRPLSTGGGSAAATVFLWPSTKARSSRRLQLPLRAWTVALCRRSPTSMLPAASAAKALEPVCWRTPRSVCWHWERPGFSAKPLPAHGAHHPQITCGDRTTHRIHLGPGRKLAYRTIAPRGDPRAGLIADGSSPHFKCGRTASARIW